jgi:hypothetical protein
MNAAIKVLFLTVALSLLASGSARAVNQVPAQGALTVDVWLNKEEGGVYQPGESMRVYFRASADAYVIVYNIDTEGYIHLVYPYGPSDPQRVEGGRQYRIPARHDPYDLVADGPQGMEFVVAVASPVPFVNLPWYLSGVPDRTGPEDGDSGDALESGQIVGDPYVGMEQLHQRIIASSAVETADATETYFYLEHRVEYPRYVCADCHYPGYGFDPYLVPCPVVTVRIDATWVRYAPVRVGVVRPRYYYYVRSTSPERYRSWKERWSTLDGTRTLRSRFVVAPPPKPVRTRDVSARQTPPEFRDLRRNRPGRLWQGRDEVLRLWEKNQSQERRRGKEQVSPNSQRGRSDENPGAPPAPNYGDGGKARERDREPDPAPKPERKREDGGRERQPSEKQQQEQEQKQQKQQEQKQQQRDDRGRDNDHKEKGPPPKNDWERKERGR